VLEPGGSKYLLNAFKLKKKQSLCGCGLYAEVPWRVDCADNIDHLDRPTYPDILHKLDEYMQSEGSTMGNAILEIAVCCSGEGNCNQLFTRVS